MITKDSLLKFMQNKVLNRLVTWFLLPVGIIAIAYFLVDSIMQPVRFQQEQKYREAEAIVRLKDLRTLQDAYKSVHGKYTDNMDSLRIFYLEESIVVKRQVGSKDDSLAMAHTKKIKESKPFLRGPQLNAYLASLYDKGDHDLVFAIDTKIPVKDTIFNSRVDFCIDSLATIPYSGGQAVEMDAVIKQVSGVKVPLFEARMPYDKLLLGLDRQLIVNLNSECETKNRYAGLQVGSVTAPNNNAGNWE